MSSSSSSSSSSGGIGFCGLLTIVFVALKLTGVIDWSWWAVTTPIWIPIVIVLTIILVIFIIFQISEKIDTIKRKMKREK